MVIYVDVDDTLVRHFGTKRIPMPASIDKVKRLHADEHTLFCWSSGGADYARWAAEDLGIVECFTAFLPKPNVIVDDQSVGDWRGCTHVYPLGSWDV